MDSHFPEVTFRIVPIIRLVLITLDPHQQQQRSKAAMSFTAPQTISSARTCPSPEGGSPYDVYDGKGQVVQNVNSHFRDLLRSVHAEYKATHKRCEKRAIANSVYMSVTRKGGRFLDADGNPKSELEAMRKIMKSLKDMHNRPGLKPNKDVLEMTKPVARLVSGSDVSSCETADDDEQSSCCPKPTMMPTMPSISQAVVLPTVESHVYRPKESFTTSAALTLASLGSMALQRRPSITLPELARFPIRSRMASINTIASFDISDYNLLLEEEEKQQTTTPEHSMISIPRSITTAPTPARSNPRASFCPRGSFYESSGLLSQALDMFQEGQVSLESFLGLGESSSTITHTKMEVSL
jgi:hypothetical protein